MSNSKEQLGKIIREVGYIFRTSDVSMVLSVSKSSSKQKLTRWVDQGWISRIRRGLYMIIPIEAHKETNPLEDAWILVPKLFAPGYVGGWSAAEYWDFTEQIFNDICILSEKSVSKKAMKLPGASFVIKRIGKKLNFGTKIFWKDQTKILISDPHKTIIDMLYDPKLGGGIQHSIDCFEAYLKSSHYNDKKLIEYGESIGKGSIFKRLGFLSELFLGQDNWLVKTCHKKITKGKIFLDPKHKNGKLVTRWQMFVPQYILEKII